MRQAAELPQVVVGNSGIGIGFLISFGCRLLFLLSGASTWLFSSSSFLFFGSFD